MSGTHASARKSFRLTKHMCRAYDSQRSPVDAQQALARIARELQRRRHRHALRMQRPRLRFAKAMKRIYGEQYSRDLDRIAYDESPMFALARGER